MCKYDGSESYHGAYEKDMVRSLKKATTTISSSMLISSPPSHMPARKAFPLELSCPKVGTGVKKKWKVGEGKGRKENACDANLTIPFSPLPSLFPLSRSNSSDAVATQASFEAETGLSVLSAQPSNFKF